MGMKTQEEEVQYAPIRERFLEAINDIPHDVNYPETNVGEVMDALQMQRQVVWHLKQGKRLPPLLGIVKLNQLYNFSLDWLLTGKGPKKAIQTKSKSPHQKLDTKAMKKDLERFIDKYLG
ncbi:MAG TPA: hypothetical protein DCQ29_02105 [Chitinophagaceae bacterium]|nr:hypothetical protein [Chitinophagaceae bacterium]